MEDRLQDLERRLARAERQVRLLRSASLLAPLCALAFIAASPAATQAGSSTVRAPFKVLDATGQAILEVSAETGVRGLRLLNVRGKPVARLEERGGGDAGGSGGSLLLSDEAGDLYASMGAGRGGASLFLKGKRREPGARGVGPGPNIRLVASERGGSVWVYDGNGRLLLVVPRD